MLHQFHFHQIHCPQFLGEFSWQDWQACLPQQNGGFHTEKTLPKMNWHCRNLELGEWLLMAKILLTRHYRQVTSTIPSFAVFSIICCATRIPKFSISFHSDLMSFFWYLQGLNQGLPLLHVFFQTSSMGIWIDTIAKPETSELFQVLMAKEPHFWLLGGLQGWATANRA